MTQKIPLNPEAELIQQLESNNRDLDVQILELAKAQAKNNEAIQNLQGFAIWGDADRPDVANEPSTDPNIIDTVGK